MNAIQCFVQQFEVGWRDYPLVATRVAELQGIGLIWVEFRRCLGTVLEVDGIEFGTVKLMKFRNMLGSEKCIAFNIGRGCTAIGRNLNL